MYYCTKYGRHVELYDHWCHVLEALRRLLRSCPSAFLDREESTEKFLFFHEAITYSKFVNPNAHLLRVPRHREKKGLLVSDTVMTGAVLLSKTRTIGSKDGSIEKGSERKAMGSGKKIRAYDYPRDSF